MISSLSMWRICILTLLSGSLYAQKVEPAQPPESEAQEPLNQSGPTVGDALPDYSVRNLPLVGNNVLDLLQVLGGVRISEGRPRERCSIPLTRIPIPPDTDFPIEQWPAADPNSRIQRITPPAPPCPEEPQRPAAVFVPPNLPPLPPAPPDEPNP